KYFLDDVRIVSGAGAVPSGGVTYEDFNHLKGRVVALEEGGVGGGLDLRMSNLVADLSKAEKSSIDIKLFKSISENQYGTHPGFTDQHALNAYLLANRPIPTMSVSSITSTGFDSTTSE